MSPGLPVASFDVLALIANVNEAAELHATRGELCTFAYLACLLSLYEGAAASEWGYSFVRTTKGSTYSGALDEAFAILVQQNWIQLRNINEYDLTTAGRLLYSNLRVIKSNSIRERFLMAASETLLVASSGVIRNALGAEPTSASAAMGDRPELLLEGVARDDLYRQLGSLAQFIGNSAADSFVVSATYIQMLSELMMRRVVGGDALIDV